MKQADADEGVMEYVEREAGQAEGSEEEESLSVAESSSYDECEEVPTGGRGESVWGGRLLRSIEGGVDTPLQTRDGISQGGLRGGGGEGGLSPRAKTATWDMLSSYSYRERLGAAMLLRGGMPVWKGKEMSYREIFYDMITEPPERWQRNWGKKMPIKNFFLT